VLSGTGVAMMGYVEVTTLHPREVGDPKLPLTSEDSPRVVHREGDLLWTIPMNMAPESHSWGRDLCGQGDRR
jgi:hypothetical protein